MKKIITAIIAISLLLACLTSCDDNGNIYEMVNYRENGLELSLPNYMRRSDIEGYDFYFTNLAIIFTAVKLDAEFLEEKNISPDITGKEYIDIYVERNGLSLDRMGYSYDEENMLHNFRYSYTDGEDMDMFYYVVVVGDVGNVWYIEMVCDQKNSSRYIQSFDVWKKYVSTYSE